MHLSSLITEIYRKLFPFKETKLVKNNSEFSAEERNPFTSTLPIKGQK